MKRSKVLITAVVVTAVIAAVAVPALARRGAARQGRAGGVGMGPMFTEEQREQIEEIHESYGDRHVELANRLQVLHVEMRELAEADGEPDFDAMERKLEEISEARLDVAKLRLRVHQDIRPILTDDQKKLFDAGIGGMMMHGRRHCGAMGGGRGMRAGRGMGPGGGMGCPMGMGPGGGQGARAGRGRGQGSRAGWGGQGMMRSGMPGGVSPMQPDGEDSD